MRDFWSDTAVKLYLLHSDYDVDTTILRFAVWFEIEWEQLIERKYSYIYNDEFGEIVEEFVSEEDYLNNKDKDNYYACLDYSDVIKSPDYIKICSEFEVAVGDTFIYEEANLFLKVVQEVIYNANNEGQSKILLQSVLGSLAHCSTIMKTILVDSKYNELQKIVAKIHYESYQSSTKMLVNKYLPIFENVVFPYIEKPIQVDIVKLPEREESFTHIFKGDSFYLWESLFEHFQLTNSSRADFKFMFEAMKFDGYIHQTVSQTAMLDWVNSKYQLDIGKPQYMNFKKNRRMRVYNDLKQRYMG